MESKQPEFIGSLKKAGYNITRFSRLPGNTLEVHLKPARLKGENGNFRALEVCDAAGLHGDCKVFSAIPQDILILRVLLPEEKPQASDLNPQPGDEGASA